MEPTEKQIRAVMRALASRGGRVRSKAKSDAARLNGRKGGRPRKDKGNAPT